MPKISSALTLWQFMLLSLLVLFAGCKEIEVITQLGTGNSQTPTPCENQTGGTGPAYLQVYCVTSFDQAAVNLARNAAEFAIQQFDWIFTNNQNAVYSSFSLRSVRAEFAHSVGLSGKGETIAIVDTGFYVDHPELAGKSITLYGTQRPESDHGTSVAAIAAGVKDGAGMLGVAYDANLHLTSISNNLSVIADATDHARQSGAIVQNNSWGYIGTDINNVISRPEGVTAEKAFADEIDVTLTVATNYLNALINFTQSGIVVFSNSNNELATHLGAVEGLPLAFPQLESGWITALNGVPTFNGAGEIISVERLSAECFELAKSCLMAEGAINGTSGAASYSRPQVGTSFAAPIISGGVAVLAEAFPSLSGPEIRDRLLVTADNSFFDPEAMLPFSQDISHGYSSEYGHGFMNLEDALLPIGSVQMPTGTSVSEGTMSLQDASIVTGFAQGDAVITALRDVDVMVIDSLAGNFNMPVEALVITDISTKDFAEFELFADNGTSQSGMAGALKTIGFILDSESYGHILGGSSFDVLSGIGMVPERSGLLYAPVTMAEVPAQAYALGVQSAISGQSDIAAYVYSSEVGASNLAYGAGFALQFGAENSRLSVGTSVMQEHGAALGMLPLTTTVDTAAISRTIDLAYSARLDDSVTFEANAQVGRLNSHGAGIWGGQNNTVFSAYGLALNVTNVFKGNDRIVASIRQPLAIDQGSMSVVLPQSRDIDGNITSNALQIGLAPSARQLDLGLEYEIPLDQFETIRFGAAYILNTENIGGETTLSLAMSYSLEF